MKTLAHNIPDFLIIGAQKAGTTSLFHYLNQHPDIFMPAVKEVHYFDLHYENGIDAYQSIFSEAAAAGKVTGEASPYYLFHPCVPSRVKEHLPEVKLIILLRNPVSRAYSHHQHSVQIGAEKALDFFEAIAMEKDRLDGIEEALIQNQIQKHYSFQHHSYVKRGFYSLQIARWLKYFPLSQMHFIQSEFFFADPGMMMKKLYLFLGVNDFEVADFTIHNQGKNSMPADPRFDTFRDLYRNEDSKIEKLTGIRPTWNFD